MLGRLNSWVVTIVECYLDQDGWTALMIVAQEGHHECLSILLVHGAEINKAMNVSALSSLCVNCRGSIVYAAT